MTLKEIAERAGVSQATVSLALSNKGRISDEVRERVIEIAAELGYTRRPRGQNVAGDTYAVGILLDLDPDWEFAWRITRSIVEAVTRVLDDRNLTTSIIPVDINRPVDMIERQVHESNVSGVFSIHYANRSLFSGIEKSGIPVILINNSSHQDLFYTVCVDDFQGAHDGTLRLIRNGHCRIVYVDFERPDMPTLVNDRLVGFRTAMDENNLDFPQSHRITTKLSDMKVLYQKLRRVMSRPDPPTAVFAHDDYLAANIVAVLENMNLTVPGDVSLVAHGDVLNYHQPFTPQISTMRINTELMGSTAAEMMIKRIAHRPDTLHVLKVNQRYVDRGSCLRLSSLVENTAT